MRFAIGLPNRSTSVYPRSGFSPTGVSRDGFFKVGLRLVQLAAGQRAGALLPFSAGLPRRQGVSPRKPARARRSRGTGGFQRDIHVSPTAGVSQVQHLLVGFVAVGGGDQDVGALPQAIEEEPAVGADGLLIDDLALSGSRGSPWRWSPASPRYPCATCRVPPLEDNPYCRCWRCAGRRRMARSRGPHTKAPKPLRRRSCARLQ